MIRYTRLTIIVVSVLVDLSVGSYQPSQTIVSASAASSAVFDDPDMSVDTVQSAGNEHSDVDELASSRPSTPTKQSSQRGFDFVTPSPKKVEPITVRRSVSAGMEDDRTARRIVFPALSLDPSAVNSGAESDEPYSPSFQAILRTRATSWAPTSLSLQLPSPMSGPCPVGGHFQFSAYSPARMFPSQIVRIPEGDPLLASRDRAQSPLTAEFLRVFSAVSLSDILVRPERSFVVLQGQTSPTNRAESMFGPSPLLRPFGNPLPAGHLVSPFTSKLPRLEDHDGGHPSPTGTPGAFRWRSPSPSTPNRKRKAPSPVEGTSAPADSSAPLSSPTIDVMGTLRGHLSDLVAIISDDQFIQDIVSFPLASYDAEKHSSTLLSIHTIVESMVRTVAAGDLLPESFAKSFTSYLPFPRSEIAVSRTPITPVFPQEFLDTLCTDEFVSTWARAIAEVFVEIDNARVQERTLLNKSAPFVLNFLWFIDQTGLVRGGSDPCYSRMLDEHEDVIARFLHLDPEYIGFERIRFATPRLAQRLIRPKFVTHGRIETEMDRLLELVEGIQKDTESWWLTTDPKTMEVPPIIVDSPIFAQAEELSNLVVRLLTERSDEFRTHARFGELKQTFRKICHGFASEFIYGLLKGSRKGLDPTEPVVNVPIRVTRVAVQLVAVCRSAIPWTYKLDVLPQLLQSGIRSVGGYHDGHVLFALPQDERMTEEFTNMMSSFNKLELMNDVIIQFTGSEAEGYTGPRREWLTRVFRDMTNPAYGLFRSDEQKMFLKPVDFSDDDDELNKWRKEKFRIFGRVLGISIRYNVVSGVRFTPGALWWLSNFGETSQLPIGAVLDDIVMREDVQFFDTVMDANISHFGPGTTFGDVVPNHPSPDTVISESNLDELKVAYKQFFSLTSIKDQMHDIFMGMADTIRVTVLHNLVPTELNELLVGSDEIDVDELIENTSFSPSFKRRHKKMFFEIIRSFDQEMLAKFLLFVSASPKPPVGGFHSPEDGHKWLHVQELARATGRHIDPDQFLPGAQTCFVQMQLPKYSSKEIMREKIIYAINHATSIEM